MTRRAPESPCISVCVLNKEDICLGCYRSVSEIGAWSDAPPEEKRRILTRAAERRRRDQPVRLA
jgi:predicted Fe-S protein YdhL (DUF1289 family)